MLQQKEYLVCSVRPVSGCIIVPPNVMLWKHAHELASIERAGQMMRKHIICFQSTCPMKTSRQPKK